MKKIALLMGIMVSWGIGVQSGFCKWIAVDAGKSSADVRLVAADESGVRLHLDFPGFESTAVELAGRSFHRLDFAGSGIWGEFGQPELPVLRKLVLLPERAGWHWEIVDADYVELSGYTPAPLQEFTMETPEGLVEPEPVFNEVAYEQDRWFPANPVGLNRPVIMGGFRLGLLELRPIQYNPARETLRVYRNLSVQVTFAGEGENPIVKPREQKSRIFSRLVAKNVVNPQPFTTDDDVVLGGYLFITPPNLMSSQWLEDLVEWKREKGFPCTVLSTSETGSTAGQIKWYIQNNIYNTWPVPPDFLVLVGDNDYGMPTHYYSYGNLATDLPYTLLEGDDYFPDMLAGRLSVDSDYQLGTICSKIHYYELNPYTQNTHWFTHGLMVYDYNGSLSCKNVKERCRDLMLEHGYIGVEEVTNPPHQSGDPWISNAIEEGVTFVNYRGYGSYSCWTPPYYSISNINSLQNEYLLPVITSIVCGGGNFVSSSYDPCFGEAWIRLGSTYSLKGAVGFMGPSSLYTHTKWNNCIDGGIYQGIFEEGIGDLASALLRGKMELYYGMPNNLGPGSTSSSVECYFHTYNILGDPGLEMWTGVPAERTVIHPDNLPVGVNSFDLNITSGSQPVEGALVCVYSSANEYQLTSWTDETGSVLMNLENAPVGTYTVTVTKHDLLPYQDNLTISQQAVALGIESFTVDDDMIGESYGDGDGQFNPGETIELQVVLKNTGTSQTATGISGTITSSDPYLTITQSTLTGPDAAPGATSPLVDDFNLILSMEAPHSHIVQVTLTASCTQGSWTNLINIPVVAPLAEAVDYTVENASGILNPGEAADVTITLLNSGGDPLENCWGTLSSPDEKLTVMDNYGWWGQITPGNSASNGTDPFHLFAVPDCPPGWTVPLQLITASGSYIDTLMVAFTVGEITEADPAGPDAYGYRCFDSRDFLYAQAPVYDWIEASAQPGQVTLYLPDNSNEADCSTTRVLPFIFRYYGQDYDTITVCSNGWLSMGDRDYYHSMRNWNIPGALGPPAMIAPFWDDLRLNDASVHFWYDAVNHRAVVEWLNSHTANGWGLNTFEAILYDPAYHPTSTGDGEIIFQYQVFNNVDGSENYCTVGIENWEQSDGVKVTYANHYTTGSAVLGAGVALKFSTDIEYLAGAPDVEIELTPFGTPIQIPASGGSFEYTIAATNNETDPQAVTVWCDVTLPNGSIVGPVLRPVTATLEAGNTLERDRTQSVPSSAPTGSYQYNAYVGAYPSTIWDGDSFAFEKLPEGYEGLVNEWKNWGELFDGEAIEIRENLPGDFSLLGVQPNPFNPMTIIRFALPEAAKVTLEVFDIAGRKVDTLVDGWREAGIQQVTFNGSNLASGIYFYKFQAGTYSVGGKMLLIK